MQNKKLSTDTPFLIDYQYKGSKRNTGDVTKYKTTQLASESLGATKYSYTYDDVGNITVVKKNGSAYSSYTYDELSQLTRENLAGKKTSVWEYDELGNITARKEYAYTTSAIASNATPTKTVAYGYGKDSKNGWENLLVSVDENGNRTTDANEKISYDAIGNPVEYLNHDMSWFGRQLEKINVGANTTDTTDNKTISFKYGADGLRRTKTVTTGSSTVTSEYVYANDLLIYEKRGNKELYFYYDGLGHLTAVRYYSSASSTTYKQYYVATNLAGDVLAFVDGDGDVVAEYEYDAWGNCTIIDDDTSVDIATLNPIRYRGYYLDSETGYYYLQSRYYDPSVGRFISADTIDVLSVSPTELTDKNLFSYCDNNPITRADNGGEVWHIVAGAAIGGIIGGISSIVGQAVSGQKINWAEVGVSAASGALTGAITTALPGMGALATGLVHGTVGAVTHATTEVVNGRKPTAAGVLAAGVTSGILAGGAKAIGQFASSKYLEKIVKEPQRIQGQSLGRVKCAAELSPQWKTGTLTKGSHAGMGWKATAHGDWLIQWHPGSKWHYGGAPYWKVSSGGNGTLRFPY